MTNRLSKLALAAALASSVPLAASASPCDGGAPAPAWPPAAAYPAPPAPPPPAPRRWLEGRWRERELAEVGAQLAALDAERDRFHARYGGRPGKVRRFERWYAARRAELEQRWWELQPVVWR